MSEEYLKIGKTLKAHGIKGELKLLVEEVFEDDVDDVEVLFLDLKGQKIPFFVEHIRGGGTAIVKLEEVKDRTNAENYQHKDVYVRRRDIRKTNHEIAQGLEGTYYYLKGFTLVEEDLGEVGTIVSIERYPHQEMAVVEREGRTALVPLVAAQILREDHGAKKVYMQLPQGLLDL